MSNTNNFSKISGLLLFVQMNEPVKAYAKPGTPPKPNEYKCSVAIANEDFIDELEAYGKSLDTLLSIKKVKTSEFEATYHCPPPEDAGKNVWVVTFRKSCEMGKTGRPILDIHKPKVFEKVGNVMLDVTHSKNVGNGSYGTISIDRFDRSNGGSSLYLKNLLVTEMIEYIKPDSDYEAGSEFDDEVPQAKAKVTTPTKAPVKAKAKPQVDEDDETLPF